MRNPELDPGDRRDARSVSAVDGQLGTSNPQSRTKLPRESGGTSVREWKSGATISVGSAGDHSSVLSLLGEGLQKPLEEDFQSRLDDPSYRPSNRLLLKRNGRTVGHVQLSRSIAWFEGQRCPLTRFHDFVVLPEFQFTELEIGLLETAEELALAEGSLLGMVQTGRSEWLESLGWSISRGSGHTLANGRSLLAHLNAQIANRRNRRPIEVRSWWHYELDAIRPIYDQVAAGMWGTLCRTEEFWRWLVGRSAHDQILLAFDRNRQSCQKEPYGSVAGYAVIRDSRILEMMTRPGFDAARLYLLARACRDAMDRDHQFVELHTCATDPCHEMLVTSGGSWVGAHNSNNGGQGMVKLFDPARWVERMYPSMQQRARESGVVRPVDVTCQVGDRRFQLILTRRSARLREVTNLPSADVQCDWPTFQSLLVSNLSFDEAVREERLAVRDNETLDVLSTLFPAKQFWQSSFELLRL